MSMSQERLKIYTLEQGYSKAQKERIARASLDLLRVYPDILDSLVAHAYIATNRDPNLLSIADTAIEEYRRTIESGILSIDPRGRFEREDDRTRLLPGQHRGVKLQYITGNNDVVYITAYGGLRDVASADDLRDSLQAAAWHDERTG